MAASLRGSADLVRRAKMIKVQGSVHRCLEIIQHAADDIGVAYQVNFDRDGDGVYPYPDSKLVRPWIAKSDQVVPLFLTWNYCYHEYDNSD